MASLPDLNAEMYNFDDYDDILYTPVPSRKPSPILSTQAISSQTFSTWSSASQINVSSASEHPFAPDLDHHQPVPRLPSFTTPSLDFHFTPPNTVSHMSLLTWSEDPWRTSSMSSVSLYSCQERDPLSYLPLHTQKLILDQAWTCDKRQTIWEWLSNVGSFHDDRTYTLIMSPGSVGEPESILTRFRNWLQNIRWRLTRRQTKVSEIHIQPEPEQESDWDSTELASDNETVSASPAESQKPASPKKTLRKRMRKFFSRMFICGKHSSD